MKLCRNKISPLFITLLLFFVAPKAEGKVSLHGDAQLSYTTYSATYDKYSPIYVSPFGKPDEEQISLRANSFVQKYSATLAATNHTRLDQRQYYTLLFGYNWKQFNTKSADNDETNKYEGTAGNLSFNGKVAYDPVHLPITLYLEAYNGRTRSDNLNVFPNEIIQDGMYTDIDNGGTVSGFKGTFVFDPERSKSLTLRGLPRLHVDYRERNIVYTGQITDKTRELAVAGLSKENNWINYRFLQYDRTDVITPSGYYEQSLQLGLVDYQKRRKWSALTNWINISADGQLTVRDTYFSEDSSEEYDVNFFAIATRKKWNASTFLNYNRVNSHSRGYDSLISRYYVPVTVKGIWGRETDWFFRVATSNSLEKKDGLRQPTVKTNSLSLGGSTFNSSSFNFSAALSLNSYSSDTGIDSFTSTLNLETRSTGRFSNKLNLAATSNTKYKDDGLPDGVSWNQSFVLDAFYRPDSAFKYRLNENMQLGSGKDFTNLGDQTTTGLTGSTLGTRRTDRNNGVADYMRSITTASLSWTKSASFSTSFDASYDLLSSNETVDAVTELNHKILYSKKDSFFNLDTSYRLRDANGGSYSEFSNTGRFLHRPNTRNEGALSYSYTQASSGGYTSSRYEITQRYKLSFFTKAGVIRDLASISEEFSYKKQSDSTGSNTFTLSGRYYPTSKTALYASVRSQSGAGILTMIYTAGASADFKLLSTSVDYSSAKRDIDHRSEQKIATSIRRSF